MRAHGEYDLVLRLTEAAASVRHVPKVLAARGPRALDPPAAERRALARALARRGVAAEIEVGCVVGHLAGAASRRAPGLVSIIIPTVAARGLVETAIRSIRAHTPAERIEIVCSTTSAATRPTPSAGRTGCAATPTRSSRSTSRSTGRASTTTPPSGANGEFLLFLNDDIEVREDGWLDALLEHAARPEVGAVGPLLLYPDGKVQHAGQFLAGSIGRHAFRFSPATSRGRSAWR